MSGCEKARAAFYDLFMSYHDIFCGFRTRLTELPWRAIRSFSRVCDHTFYIARKILAGNRAKILFQIYLWVEEATVTSLASTNTPEDF